MEPAIRQREHLHCHLTRADGGVAAIEPAGRQDDRVCGRDLDRLQRAAMEPARNRRDDP
jgi:hypothetical protein